IPTCVGIGPTKTLAKFANHIAKKNPELGGVCDLTDAAISQLARPRIPELSASSSIDPMEALKTYLNNREDLKDIAAAMLEAAQKLLADDVEIWLEAATNE
ncbi:hypothetical protein VF12_31795, partial [Nostoc linckia z15]